MDTDVFIDHVMDRYLFSVNAFDSHVMYNIEIAPYVALLEVQSVQFHHLFYSKFNRLLDAVGMLSSEQKIKSHMDLLYSRPLFVKNLSMYNINERRFSCF